MRISTAWTTSVFIAAASFCLYGQAQPAGEQPKSGPQPSRAEGVPARTSATDYPTHVKVGDFTIAAEFMGHSVPTPEATLSSDDYVVVETAFFGPSGAKLKLSLDD